MPNVSHKRESEVESYLVRRLEELGISCLKFNPDNCIGMPDRIALLPGGSVHWIEMKTKGGHLEEIQKYRHKKLTDIGHEIYVLWNTQEVDKYIGYVKQILNRGYNT